ncbi:MAG: ATP-grasp domain-containing protein [Candidatus Aminicenantes bacterium]|nr:ATP-grasp domain-containing protein [Candidatus Aminicenantes bacterium]
MKNECIVGISGINAVDNPGPGVGLARALRDDRQLNVKIVGLAYDAMEPGIYLDWLIDKSFILPYPSSGKDAFIQRLAYIKQSYGLDFIFPSLDSELPLYAGYCGEIEKLGIRLFVPEPEQLRLRDKERLPETAKKIGIDSPGTKVVRSYLELPGAIKQTGLPVMVKGAMCSAFKAHTGKEAADFFSKIVSQWGYPVILQEVVKGDEMNVVGVGDGQGGLIGQVGIKKMWITSLGKIWTGVTVKNRPMLRAAETFVREYRWKGPFELECIVDGDTVYLIEINPRFPAWSYFAAGVGVNLPANTVRRAFGLPYAGNNDYEAGKLYIRYTYETITGLDAFQDITIKGEN